MLILDGPMSSEVALFGRLLRALRVSVVCILFLSWSTAFAAEPARGLAAIKVPEGFEVSVAVPSDISSYPMFMTFDHDGRLFVAESSGKNVKGKDMPKYPECMILMIEDTDKDGVFDKRTVFADKLSLPMGVLWYRGAVYCASPPDFLRLEDTDNDGVADKRDVLLTGWNVLNTASLHGPFLGPDGYMYLTHGRHGYDITSKEGVRFQGLASRIWRCKPDGTQLERFCGGGFDNPIEVVWLDNGDLIGTMTYFTDPMNGQRDALMHWIEGGVYPKMHESTAEFVRTGDLMPVLTKFARIAPSGLMVYRGAQFGDEYRGNLFSAQFNPHRVQRHVLTPQGGSYACADTDFLTSSDPDFHPTDVMEDVDGSILVSDTGGWYVDACPISRVAKPEVRGSIYRVRKVDAHTPNDPIQRLAPGAAPTPVDRVVMFRGQPYRQDKAFEELAALQGAERDAAIQAIERYFTLASQHDSRVVSLFESALAQWNTPDSRRVLRERVRWDAQAAYLAGTIGDSDAAENLIAALQSGPLSLRREAAASLGRLKAIRAVPVLLGACSTDNDRFLEHAIIYALIQIADQEPLLAALQHENPASRKAAFIALDQLQSEKLTADHAIAFLNSDDESLRKTGLWVVSRHPDWSGSVLALLESKITATDFASERGEAIREVLLAYAHDAAVQEFMARVAADDAMPAPRRVFLLDTIEKVGVNPMPDVLVRAVGRALAAKDETVRYRAATLIASRNIAAFDERLLALADDPGESTALRISALGTAQARRPELTDAQYRFLLDQLAANPDPALRLSAGKVIGGAKLGNEQLRALADTYLPKADALTFSALIDAFKKCNDESVGLALVKSISAAAVAPSVIPGGLDALLAPYPESVKRAAAPLRAQVEAEEQARLEKLAALEPLIGEGDVGRGRQLFFNEKIACFTCHTVGAEGGTVGPDLTTIGAIRSGHDLLEAILFPNASFVPGYETVRITAKDPEFGGTVDYVGVIGEQTADAVLLRQNAKDSIRIARSDIESMDQAPNSIMPQGLDTGMTQEQLLDLLAFLQSLNNEQWLLPERRETAANR